MRLVPLVLAATVALASPAFALGPAYVTALNDSPSRGSIGFFATTCPEAARAECGYVNLTCDSDNLALIIQGFDAHELGEWLQNGLSASISGATPDDLMATSMFLTEDTGWSVRFEFADGRAWLQNPALQSELAVTEFHGTVPLSLGDLDKANFSRFVADCQKILGPAKQP